ncbi:MAG: DUF2231 domain-containing protein [Pseudomonadota bacterium]|nr:DUF2231 domain-containing protein [Pseudomonadota bacterium]
MFSRARSAAGGTTTVVTTPGRLGLASQPVYATLVQFPAVCFLGALITDIAYWRSTMFIWETFSIWLLTAGCIFGGLAAIAGLITWVSHRHVRAPRFAALHVLVSVAALVLSIINAFVHSRDGYTAVVPLGISLSIVVAILMLAATWLGWPRTHTVAAASPSTNAHAGAL